MMTERLTIKLDGRTVIEFSRSAGVPGHQRAFLERMDADMDGGILLGDEKIDRPDSKQRAHYVVEQLHYALQDGNQPLAAVLCTYIARNLPELKSIRFDLHEDRVEADLVYC